MRKAGSTLQSRLIWKMVGLSVVIHALVFAWVARDFEVGTTPSRVRVQIQSPQGTRAIRTTVSQDTPEKASSPKRSGVQPPPVVSVTPPETSSTIPDQAAAPPAVAQKAVPSPPSRQPAVQTPTVRVFGPVKKEEKVSAAMRAEVVSTSVVRTHRQATSSHKPIPRTSKVRPSRGVTKRKDKTSTKSLPTPVAVRVVPQNDSGPPQPSPASPAPLQSGAAASAKTTAEAQKTSHVDSPGKGPQEGNRGEASPSGLLILHKTNPAYPPDARKRGEEGTVWLRLEVLSDGRVGKVEIAQSSGFGSLDRTAARSAESWKFGFNGHPPTKSAWAKIPIRFVIVYP